MTDPVIPPVSDEQVNAALKALGWPITVDDILRGYEGECPPEEAPPEFWLEQYRNGAAEVVAAVRPLIEAEARADERSKIARAIYSTTASYPAMKRWLDGRGLDVTVGAGQVVAEIAAAVSCRDL